MGRLGAQVADNGGMANRSNKPSDATASAEERQRRIQPPRAEDGQTTYAADVVRVRATDWGCVMEFGATDANGEVCGTPLQLALPLLAAMDLCIRDPEKLAPVMARWAAGSSADPGAAFDRVEASRWATFSANIMSASISGLGASLEFGWVHPHELVSGIYDLRARAVASIHLPASTCAKAWTELRALAEAAPSDPRYSHLAALDERFAR